MLHIKNIEKYYGSKNNVTKALDRISFDVEDGEFIAIMGASGSGKTTLLNCISTIDTASAGSILLDGENITEIPSGELARFRRERLGFVFQDFNLLDTLTLEENIGLALTINHADALTVQKKVHDVAIKLGIEDALSKFPYQVSGGQKQRVWIAMALAQDTKVLFLDEPTTYLDVRYQLQILKLIQKLNREYGITIVMVLHDINQSLYYSDEIVAMKDGRMIAHGLPEEIITKELVQEVYGVDLTIQSVDGKPFVIPV